MLFWTKKQVNWIDKVAHRVRSCIIRDKKLAFQNYSWASVVECSWCLPYTPMHMGDFRKHSSPFPSLSGESRLCLTNGKKKLLLLIIYLLKSSESFFFLFIICICLFTIRNGSLGLSIYRKIIPTVYMFYTFTDLFFNNLCDALKTQALSSVL